MVRQKITKFLNKIHTPPWVVGILGGIFLLRIPSFFEPFSYGDEMIYLSLGEAVKRGLTLYKDIHDNKPPLLYLVAAVANTQFWFKFILMLWHLFSTAAFFYLNLDKRLRLKYINMYAIERRTYSKNKDSAWPIPERGDKRENQ